MKHYIRSFFLFGIFGSMMGQPIHNGSDTLFTALEEVVIDKVNTKKTDNPMKLANTVDELLASSAQISFVKRGAYAWEPMLNNMASERASVTMDGMHIFGACTDKMDPITSYVERNNLASIEITSGQEGGSHGATLAGNIDLIRKITSFKDSLEWAGSYQTGFEHNNKQFFNLGNVSYASRRFVADGSFSYREAANYQAGGGKEIAHSPFKKWNASLGLGYKTGDLSSVRVDAIFDQAKDVGYPALPMDLWLSRALITSLSFKQDFKESWIKVWDSKIYFNAMEHYMDDTTRPENLVHMDMPGWSTTYGLLSKIIWNKGDYSAEVQWNAYSNVSIAEMRMYPQDRSERTMFAYTWPWVTTRYTGLSMNNTMAVSNQSALHFGGAFGVQDSHSKYIDFNWIFYPDAPQQKTRFLPSVFVSYDLKFNRFKASLGGGYGHRAPSVSEAYGYYIYNSFDRYDYIGNPNLKNEVSYEVNARLDYKKDAFQVEVQANYFHIQDYIVGKILNMGSPMNYQSTGVKGYTSLQYARLFNLAIQANGELLHDLHWNATLTYARGKDYQEQNLPFIRPWSYQMGLHYSYKKFQFQASWHGDSEQKHYSPEYGEDATKAYSVWNFALDYTLRKNSLESVIQLGVENIFDTYYTTYADWGNIPRMGRNIYMSLKINL